MNSRIYSGILLHHRLEKKEHRFQYPAYFYALDLDELEDLSRNVRGFSYNHFAPASIYDQDYLEHSSQTIRQKLDCFLKNKGISNNAGRVMLVTCARYFGAVFNPVSFYYGYGKNDALLWVVMEVNNTFGERHLYILDKVEDSKTPGYFYARSRKEFHVSPFFDRTGEYQCFFSPLGEEVDIRLELIKEGKMALMARWKAKSKPMSSSSLAEVMFRYPFLPWLTLPAIHWQAAKLYFQKKLSVYRKPLADSTMTIRVKGPTFFQKIALNLFLKGFSKIRKGKLALVLPDKNNLEFGEADQQLPARLNIRSYDFFTRVIRDAGIGLGEGYMEKDWESQDPLKVLMLLIENRDYLASFDGVSKFLGAWISRAGHILKSNTRGNSRENIQKHYDLSNDFFKIFLDPTMLYSSAIFESENESLEAAQYRKVHRILDKANILAGQHILEIGCGWGTLAIEAVKRTGCFVTGLTLSQEQLCYAKERVAKEGLQDKIDLRLCDYRDITGNFDRIISIEMLEAVGHEHFDAFFRSVDHLLRPDGIGVFQVITIADERYEAYRKGCDFIQKHIFPGGHLPSLRALSESMSRVSDLKFVHQENIGLDYARTLERWRKALLSGSEEVKKIGFDERFIRKWEYYFLYCEAAFLTRQIQDWQLILKRA